MRRKRKPQTQHELTSKTSSVWATYYYLRPSRCTFEPLRGAADCLCKLHQEFTSLRACLPIPRFSKSTSSPRLAHTRTYLKFGRVGIAISIASHYPIEACSLVNPNPKTLLSASKTDRTCWSGRTCCAQHRGLPHCGIGNGPRPCTRRS